MAGPSTPERGAEAPLVARLRLAFSPRRNLASLVRPPDARFLPVDGLRALAILATLLFHSLWYLGELVPTPVYLSVLGAPWALPLWRGHFGVDLFFVLSGFLIARMLLGERERTGSIRLGFFYVRRLFRLWPALLVAAALDGVLLAPRPHALWANVFYVSNYLPIAHAAMAWTWSLAIEEHFYLVCPWLVELVASLGTRGRLLAVGTLLVLLSLVGAWVTVRGEFHAFDFEIVVNRAPTLWARGYDALYTKPWMRVGPLLCGVGAAIVHRDVAWLDALGRARRGGTLLLAGALVLGACATHWPLVAHAPRWLEVLYLSSFRTAFGLAAACVLLFSLSVHPVGLALGRALSVRALFPFAQLAYSAYLLNPIVTIFTGRALWPWIEEHELPVVPILAPASIGLTFLAAAVLYLFVERPFMELRPRAADAVDAAGPRRAASGRARAAGAAFAVVLLGVALPYALATWLPVLAVPDRARDAALGFLPCPELDEADAWADRLGEAGVEHRGRLLSCVHATELDAAELAAHPFGAGAGIAPRFGYDLFVVTYVSEGRTGEARALSALYYTPRDAGGELPLVVLGHGGSGVAPSCGASHISLLTDPIALPLVGAGYAVFAPDYAGMGVEGEPTSYLVGEEEAAATLDGARAALELHDPRFDARRLSGETFFVGHSQGGHASLFAHQLFRPVSRLRLGGTVAIAPALGRPLEWIERLSDPERRLELVDYATLLTFHAHATRAREPLLEAWLAPEAARALPALLSGECFPALAGRISERFPTVGALYRPELVTAAGRCVHEGACADLEPWHGILRAEEPGHVTSAAPTLLLVGLDDEAVSPASVRCIADRIAGWRSPVEAMAYPGARHFDVLVSAVPDTLRWLEARRGREAEPLEAIPLEAGCPGP